MKISRNKGLKFIIFILAIVMSLCITIIKNLDTNEITDSNNQQEFYESIPEYKSKPYVLLGDGKAHFSNEDIERLSIPGYEYYSALDNLGRCGYAEACVGKETMPTDERGDIYKIHPSGWHSNCGYERCHLIAFCLTGENANDHNLATGTGYMNRSGMLPFELKIAKYIDRTGNHVMYRSTPIYLGNELICRGVHLEARSIEDNGTNFDVFCYNIEPGKEIDYLTGYLN